MLVQKFVPRPKLKLGRVTRAPLKRIDEDDVATQMLWDTAQASQNMCTCPSESSYASPTHETLSEERPHRRSSNNVPWTERFLKKTRHTGLHGETPGTTTATEVWAGLKPDGLEEIPPDLDDVASVAVNEAPCHWAMWAISSIGNNGTGASIPADSVNMLPARDRHATIFKFQPCQNKSSPPRPSSLLSATPLRAGGDLLSAPRPSCKGGRGGGAENCDRNGGTIGAGSNTSSVNGADAAA